MTDASEFRVTGGLVLAIFLGFFAVTIGVNALFIYLAASTHPGVEVDRSYVQGLDYNNVIAERAAQRERGWTAAIGAERDARAVEFTVRVRDAAGRPLNGLALTGTARRPRTDEGRRVLNFVDLGDGEYRAQAMGVVSGGWRVDIETRFPDGVPFRASRELVLE